MALPSSAEGRRIDAQRRATGAADDRVAMVERVDQQRFEIEDAGRAESERFVHAEVCHPQPRAVEINILTLLTGVVG